MMRAAAQTLVVVVVALGAACNPLVALSESGAFGGAARAALAEDCCDCLVRAELEDYDVGCPAVAADTDAGALPEDGGVAVAPADAGRQPTPCLCDGVSEPTCVARLLEKSDEPVLVVGACVRRELDRQGPCGEACGGVLAYPDDAAASP